MRESRSTYGLELTCTYMRLSSACDYRRPTTHEELITAVDRDVLTRQGHQSRRSHSLENVDSVGHGEAEITGGVP
jgi:hypothetical protein